MNEWAEVDMIDSLCGQLAHELCPALREQQTIMTHALRLSRRGLGRARLLEVRLDGSTVWDVGGLTCVERETTDGRAEGP